MNIWFGGLNFGAFYGYTLQYLFLDVLELHWTAGFLLQTALFFLAVVLMRAFVPEKTRDRSSTALEKAKMSYSLLKEHYGRKPSNIWLCVDFNFQENMLFEMFFWAQYYFVMIGFGGKATAVALAIPIANFSGSLVLNPLLSKCANRKVRFTLGCTFMMVISSALMLAIPPSLDGFYLYMAAFSSITFFGVLPFTKSITDEVLERTSSSDEKYIVTNFMRAVRELFTGVMMLLTGYLMNFGNCPHMQMRATSSTSSWPTPSSSSRSMRPGGPSSGGKSRRRIPTRAPRELAVQPKSSRNDQPINMQNEASWKGSCAPFYLVELRRTVLLCVWYLCIWYLWISNLLESPFIWMMDCAFGSISLSEKSGIGISTVQKIN